MADVFTKEKRSWVMSRIRSKDTKVELAMARALRRAGIRYRRYPRLPGSPDFLIFSGGRKALLFVDGDFWHGWKYAARKKKLSAYWRAKIEGNTRRDKMRTATLRRSGWVVIRLWEHEIISSALKAAERVKLALEAYD